MVPAIFRREKCQSSNDFRCLRVYALSVLVWFSAAALFSPRWLMAAPQPLRWTPAAPMQENKHFAGCSAQFLNSDGLVLGYSLSDKMVWTLELSNQTWKFPPGASFTVLLRIGDLYLSQPATAISGQTVRVHLKDSLQIFRVLSRVWQFELMAGAVNSRFSLAFGDRVLTDLVRCVEKRQASPRVTKGLEPIIGAAPLEDSDKAADKEAETLNGQILRAAGVSGIPPGNLMPLAVKLHPNSVTRVDANLLMTSVIPAAGFADIQALAQAVVMRDMRACRGDLFAGLSFERLQQKPAARGYVSCRSLQSGTSVHYAIVSRPAGGYYLIANIFTGPELVDATEQAAAVLDQQVWGALAAMPLQHDSKQ